MTHSLRIVVGITGASGSIYGRTLIERLIDHGYEVHLIASPTGHATWQYELGEPLDPERLASPTTRARLVVHRHDDLFACVASGSWHHDGMIVAPCSAKTLAQIAHGLADNALARAADVCLKERRPLVLVLRETPLSLVHIENMAAVTRAGAIVLPACPGFYGRPKTIDDLVEFVVGRALDPVVRDHGVGTRWNGREC